MADDLAEFGRGEPRRPGVDHPVAVRAEQGKVADRAYPLAADVQRLDVMAFHDPAAALIVYAAGDPGV
jgi:hypothetical protein